MSLDPDNIPEGLLTLPLEELTDVDLESLRQLRDCAVRGDWKGAMQVLTDNTKRRNQEKKP